MGRSRRQLLRRSLVLVALGLLAGCRQPVPPAAATPSRRVAPATPLPAKVRRVGALWADAPSDLSAGFAQALVDLGHAVGPGFALDIRWVRGREDLVHSHAADLVRLGVDVIVAPSTPAALAARRATATIPIVMVASGDPIVDGLIASFARPGGNVTGLSAFTPDMNRGRLELLREAFPGIGRVAVLWHAADPGKAHEVRMTQLATHALGLRLDALGVGGPDEVGPALQAAALGPADALVVLGDAVTHACRAEIATFAARRHIAVLYDRREYYVDDGGLMAYGPSFPELFRRSAAYVDEILRGARPSELPVEQPTTADLTINLQAAQAVGLTIPQQVLRRASEVLR
jgi:putative tryptophan/tyrosine transport system substrate-binding protein